MTPLQKLARQTAFERAEKWQKEEGGVGFPVRAIADAVYTVVSSEYEKEIALWKDRYAQGLAVKRHVVAQAERAEALEAELARVKAESAPVDQPCYSRQEVEAALRHITSWVDTGRILERLGYTEQEIADAIR